MENLVTTIDLRLFATLGRYLPADAERFPVEAGVTVGKVLARLGVPLTEAKLVFIDGVKGTLETVLRGGERVGVFPPVGGG